MARITSKIEFYRAVPIPFDFKHTPLFRNEKEQVEWFDKFKVKELTITDSSYQRVEEQIRTGHKYEDLVNINYVHIINPSAKDVNPENHEWWGFVADIHYINDGLVTVDWVVDPLQTFMWKWDLSKAFMERGMASIVEKKKNEKGKYVYNLKEDESNLLNTVEPIGVDGLAYQVDMDNLIQDSNDTGRVSFAVIVSADADNFSFVGTPSQLTYHVLPFDKKSGTLVSYEIANVLKNGGGTTTLSYKPDSGVSLLEALKEMSKNAEFNKSVKRTFFQNEIGLAFNYSPGPPADIYRTKLKDGRVSGLGRDAMELVSLAKGSGSSGGDGDGGSSGGSSQVPADKKEFLKLNVGNDFGVNEAKFLVGAKKSARVMSWLGGSDANIKKVAEIVKKNGMSPELFFAYDIQEGGTSWGWLNHTNYTGDPYTDADSVSKWAVSQANKTGSVQLAWYDAGNPYYTTPVDKQAEGQAFADALPKGAIGRMYLAGTAAATWAAFDPDALKGSVNGVQDYGDPIKGCMDLLKAWA